MKKPLAFISYIHEDEHFAVSLRDWVSEALLGGLDFFVAGDQGSIPLGTEWPKKISAALQECAVALLVLSPQSSDRKWIYFEAGAAFARGVPVIPVCCKGMSKSALTPPLSFLQAVELPDGENESALLQDLARICELNPPKTPQRLPITEAHLTPSLQTKADSPSILDSLLQPRLPRLLTEWKDKILSKLDQLQAQKTPTPQLKDRLKSYLLRLSQDREKYVRESKQQIATLPETLRQQNPEGGLHVAIGAAVTTSVAAEYIKASELLLEVLPGFIQLCGNSESTPEGIAEYLKARFDDLAFQNE